MKYQFKKSMVSLPASLKFDKKDKKMTKSNKHQNFLTLQVFVKIFIPTTIMRGVEQVLYVFKMMTS